MIQSFNVLSDPFSWIIIVAVLFILWLLLREFRTWYWKIDRIVELLESIEKNTKPQTVQRVVEISEEKEVGKENGVK